jgi:hypothetical protein
VRIDASQLNATGEAAGRRQGTAGAALRNESVRNRTLCGRRSRTGQRSRRHRRDCRGDRSRGSITPIATSGGAGTAPLIRRRTGRAQPTRATPRGTDCFPPPR